MSPEAREGAPPGLSVVIASVNGHRYVSQCLASLAKQRERARVEVIVVEGSGDDTAARIAVEHPWARVLPISPPRPLPELRSLGIRAARAPVVATSEDHCVFDEEWCIAILRAHAARPEAAIGGAVENGSTERRMDWAAYLCEYGKFMLPVSAAAVTDLAGPNVSYKREVLEAVCGDLLDGGRAWEHTLHSRLLARGFGLWLDPTLVVYHAKRFVLGEFLAQRYYFGRAYAAARVAAAPLVIRAAFAVAAPLLPPLFLWRYARQALGRRRHVGELIRSAPLLALFAAAWSAGELVGYALGDGGASARVK